jgi:hypothetical protein
MPVIELQEIFGPRTELILILMALWSIPWKGVALWKAVNLKHKWWFIILLVANTVAILEIIYIFFVAKKYENAEVESIEDSM